MSEEKYTQEVSQKLQVGNLWQFLTSITHRGFKCSNVLDVGANKGEWSTLVKKIFPDANMFMIEPLAEMEDNLKKFCIENPGSRYFMYGAASAPTKWYLTTWGDDLAGASCVVPENQFLKSQNKQREIELITIDSLIEEGKVPIPELAKLDIQGYEIEALKGATKLLGKTELLILECSLYQYSKGIPLASDVIGFMKEKGYEVYDFVGFNRRPFDQAIGQMDICFARADGILRRSNLWLKEPSAD